MMLRKKAFRNTLTQESPKWVSAGIIDADQQTAILAQYEPQKSEHVSVARRLPIIVMGLAVILIGVGLLLFYAANWRKMPPALKLLQVFGLLGGTYGASYYLLAVRQDMPRLGRALLRLGMIAFGVGIALIAQIYHISAHPANGVLLWCAGVLATSLILQDPWGYALALLLAFIWNAWEYFVYQQPNYLFFVVPLVVLWGFYRLQAKAGVAAAALALLFWTQQLTWYWIETYHQPTALLFFMALPLGVISILLGRASEEHPALAWASRLTTFAGWVGVFLPLILLSWPVEWFSSTFPWLAWSPLLPAYLLLSVIAGVLLYRRHRQGHNEPLAAACLGYGLLCLALPLGHLSTFMVVTHLALLAFWAGLLYTSYRHLPHRRLERFLAFAFPILIIVSKAVGFLSLGLSTGQFLLAYGIGFIIFGTVCLLINQSITLLLQRRQLTYPGHILDSVCTATGFGILYALSFELPRQKSVLDTSPVVLTLLVLFVALAAGLYLFLWRKSAQKIILLLSALIFFSSLAMLVLTGPALPRVVPSLTFNALLLLLTGTLLYYSTRINSARLANITIVCFLIQVVTRYFDIFWDLLSGSLLFIITGAMALGGGYFLERQRRRVLRTIAQQTKGESP